MSRAQSIFAKVESIYQSAKAEYLPEYPGDVFEGIEFTPSGYTSREELREACRLIRENLGKRTTILMDGTIRVSE